MAILSPATLARARKSFLTFNTLNSIAFSILSGSFITLFALKLGATNAFIGLLNSLAYVTFFFLPLGKRLVRQRSIVKVFGWAWIIRYLAMLPALAAPFLVRAGFTGAAFALILAAVAGFNLFKGIGLIGNNPVLIFLAEGGSGAQRKDKGSFLVTAQIGSSLAGLGTNLAVAIFLGKSANPLVYAAMICLGIVIGILGSIPLLRVPEPTDYKSDSKAGLLKTSIEALKEKPFRTFMIVYALLAFVAGMGRSFLPVYAKEVFGQGDDAVMIYAFIGSVGYLAMGLLTRVIVDRLGAKPLYVIFTAVSALSFIPLALPIPTEAKLIFALLAFVNFFSTFGFSGEENAAQTYFFVLVKPERSLDLGVLYFVVYGLGGSLGAGAGGLVLDFLGGLGMGPETSYRIFYGFLLLLLALTLIKMGRLSRLGSASVRESLEVMLSFRDLKVFNMLTRLDQSSDPADALRIINELGNRPLGPSAMQTQRELLRYLESPRFDVRIEALLALEKMPKLGPNTAKALIKEIQTHTFTTAYAAARILGSAGCKDATEALRAALKSEDYMLSASAMIALARLGDDTSIPFMEELLAASDNPRILIFAAYALELLNSRSSVPVIVSCMRRENPPPFASDELVLAAASILGLMPRFYSIYSMFLENEEAGIAMLEDIAAEADIGQDSLAFVAQYRGALERLLAEPMDGAPMSRILLGATRRQESRNDRRYGGGKKAAMVDIDPAAAIVLSEAALDPGLGYRGFRFLIAAYAAFARGMTGESGTR